MCINRALGRIAPASKKSEGGTDGDVGCGENKGSNGEQCRTAGRCPVCSAAVSGPPVRCMHLDSICRKAAEQLVGDERKQWQERLQAHHEPIAPLLEAEAAAAAQADVHANAADPEADDGDAGAGDAVGHCGSDDEAGGEPRCASCNEVGHAEHECPYRDDDEEEGLRDSDHQESSSSDDDDSDDLEASEAGEESGVDSSDDDYN